MYDKVQEYYGQTLQHSDDLQTNACCDQPPPDWLKPVLGSVHDEVLSRYYGCSQSLPVDNQFSEHSGNDGGCC
ncbi:MAG: hypothetical protein RIC89_03395 [Pseudomonadales bacterium]